MFVKDPVHPGPERTNVPRTGRGLQDAEPRVGHDILGDGLAGHVHARDAEHLGLVLADQHREGRSRRRP
jgi:hypothetical protein